MGNLPEANPRRETMARKMFGLLLIGLVAAGWTVKAHADEEALKKELAQLNVLTGTDPTTGAFKAMIKDKKNTQQLIEAALPLAQKKELGYNAALVLGLAAAEKKDMKTAEIFFRVCMDQAAKLQSFE